MSATERVKQYIDRQVRLLNRETEELRITAKETEHADLRAGLQQRIEDLQAEAGLLEGISNRIATIIEKKIR